MLLMIVEGSASVLSLSMTARYHSIIVPAKPHHTVYSLLKKMKVGLSNHQPVRLSVCVHLPVCLCVPLITFEPISGFS
jgi:hypothetical protein